VQALPDFYDASGVTVEQHLAKSKDGTKVPYYEVSKPRGAAAAAAPTLLYGYGGFEISLLPSYSATVCRELCAENTLVDALRP
jgi:prolyl oligopeptidase